MPKKEKEKGFIDQISELVVPIITIIIVVFLLYVLQAVVNIMNFLSNNPWVGWVVFGLLCIAGFFFLLFKLGFILPNKSRFRMNVEFLENLPIEVRERLEEAQGTFCHGHYRSSCVMMRGALETAISIRFRRSEKEKMLRRKNLPQRIELAKQEGFITPSIANRLNHFVKWIGDIGAHDYKVKIRKEDVEKGFQTLRIALEHMLY